MAPRKPHGGNPLCADGGATCPPTVKVGKADITVTCDIHNIAQSLGIALHDHIIIAAMATPACGR